MTANADIVKGCIQRIKQYAELNTEEEKDILGKKGKAKLAEVMTKI